jgi:hypothetical protein
LRIWPTIGQVLVFVEGDELAAITAAMHQRRFA